MSTKTIVSSLIICILISLCGYVYAALDANLTIDCVDTANSGDEISLNLKLKINSVEKGLDGLVAELVYPSDILTMLTPESSDILIMDGYLLVTFDEPLTSGEKVLTLKFIVKNNVSEQDAIIKLSNISVTDVDGITSTELDNIEKKIQINKKEVETPTEKKLTNIQITKAPSKTTYKEGEYFDKTGMEITATYSDNSSKVVEEYTYSPSNKLEISDTKIIITYSENDITKSVDQNISVIKNESDSSDEDTDDPTDDDNINFDDDTSTEDDNIDFDDDISTEDSNDDIDNELDIEDDTSKENNSDSDSDKPSTNNIDNTISNKPYPYTGIQKIILPIMLILIIGIFSYNRYKTYKGI